MWIVALDPPFFRLVALAWQRASSLAGLKQDALASLMGLTHNQLADQLSGGRGHLSVQRLVKLRQDRDGRRFVQFFLCELASPGRLERLVNRHSRVMLKADLRPSIQSEEEHIA